MMKSDLKISARGKISRNYKMVVLFEGNEHLLCSGEDE